jgi:hypothetical protein
MPPGPAPVVVQKKRGMGCWGCGCSILGVIVLLIAALVIGSCYVTYHAVYNATTAQAVPIPVKDGGDAVYASAHQKVDAFTDSFERQQPATLHLDSDEINTLISRDPTFASMRGRALVKLGGDTADVQFSLPLGEVESFALTDRHLNGTGTIAVSFDPTLRSFTFDLRALRLGDKDVPAQSAASLGPFVSQIVNQRLQQNQLAKDFVARVQKAGIENGELVIEIR